MAGGSPEDNVHDLAEQALVLHRVGSHLADGAQQAGPAVHPEPAAPGTVVAELIFEGGDKPYSIPIIPGMYISRRVCAYKLHINMHTGGGEKTHI